MSDLMIWDFRIFVTNRKGADDTENQFRIAQILFQCALRLGGEILLRFRLCGEKSFAVSPEDLTILRTE
jgi:hypothetical protein